ncbi:HAMP domain-containing histidine kinase [Burkholderia latens]|uniref:sensor histidine kinase n=1 Tax=Burkholderia latens TaxID=488446 RepID=UPI001C9457DE|nr:HAMP domain-containing sensor histidine kinase [Burkholderia latens]MBY4693154.1 HAMP domain-containing histidine kinase [Burkholderia latens]
MAHLPTLSSATLFESRATRGLRGIARAVFPHSRELVALAVCLMIVGGVAWVAAGMYDARTTFANALRPAAGNGLLIAAVATLAFMLVATALWAWLRMLRLDATVRDLADAIDKQGIEALPDTWAERGAPSIATLARAINGAHRQHAERMTELLHVLAAYAHDLRTPLTRLMLRSGMLDDGVLRDAIERDLAEMAELVDASLACARLQCSVPEPPRRVDADEMLGVLVGSYRDAGLTVDLDGRVGRPLVTFPHALRRVLVNLIDNALRYGGEVRLCVRVDGRHVMLTVLDSGPGIVPAELEAVFKPWYRAPQTSARAPGSGLGLAIARRLTRAMQGDLQLNNRSTGGLEARVTLPLAPA